MQLILGAYERKSINSSGGVFTAHQVEGSIELQGKGLDDVLLESGDQISVNNVKQIVLQNLSDQQATIEYDILTTAVDKKSQHVNSKIVGQVSISDMPAVQVQASVAAANDAGDVVTITLAAGETKLVLAANDKRHSASAVRGETDLYNIKLGYKSAANAQVGMPFAPQATMTTRSQAAIYAHNHSAETQTVIAVETTINTGA